MFDYHEKITKLNFVLTESKSTKTFYTLTLYKSNYVLVIENSIVYLKKLFFNTSDKMETAILSIWLNKDIDICISYIKEIPDYKKMLRQNKINNLLKTNSNQNE